MNVSRLTVPNDTTIRAVCQTEVDGVDLVDGVDRVDVVDLVDFVDNSNAI